MDGYDVSARLREEGADVFYSTERIAVFGPSEIEFLKTRAAESPRLRSRLCMHADTSAAVHEMVIVHHRDVYVRPNRLHGRTKSQFALEGTASVLFFDEGGDVCKSIHLGGDRTLYYRVPEGVWHCLVIESDWFVFLESIGGPSGPESVEFAPWSPPNFDARYMTSLRERSSML